MVFRMQGTCARQVSFEVEDRKVKAVRFEGGCNGNLQGISRLVEGMDIDEAITRMRGICCGYKNTSCPDQLAQALEQCRAALK